MILISSSSCQVEAQTGKKFGSTTNPLLLSVRSGAAMSMPGMMDTVLNLVSDVFQTTGDGRPVLSLCLAVCALDCAMKR
jgi:hypothetical protein